MTNALTSRDWVQTKRFCAQCGKTTAVDINGPALENHAGWNGVFRLANGEADDIDAARRKALAHRSEVRNDIERVIEVSDRVVEIDRAIELASEFIGWSPHVADKNACTALRKSRGRADDRALLKIASCDFRALPLKVFEPKPGPARWIDDALRRLAQMLAYERVDGASDVGRRCEEGCVNGAAAVEGRHGGVRNGAEAKRG